MKKKTGFLFIILGIWALLSFSGSLNATDDLMSAAGVSWYLEKTKAPDFELHDLEGKRVKLKDFRDKVVLLDFWTTW